jgi:putative CocE/NonD family hydrolase
MPQVIENLFIPLADGTRLAARVWMPDGIETHPAPALLEYIPYRKRDGTRTRDEPMHGFFAAQGYVSVRVDMRGSGESDGLMADEYLPLEQQDAVEVIAWIAAQSWSNGNVGMFGKSWGGFNCLQVAALRPPALKAIISLNSTDDRYADDIHYMGGCLLNDNLWWATIMLAYQSRPTDPEITGPGWRDMWRERMLHLPFFPAIWVRHQHRDVYWQQGSICEDWSAIQCPVMAVGGWADAYTNAVPRLLAGLQVPRRGIIGPWAHLYPQDGVPEPAIGFLQEATRWWDHWLKDDHTSEQSVDGADPGIPAQNRGIMAEPMLRAWIEDYVRPTTTQDASPGHWVGEPVWPPRNQPPLAFYLGRHALAHDPQPPATLSIRSPQYTGGSMGEWMGMGLAGDRPTDQRFDDGWSLVFDSEPLIDRLEILGAPELTLDLSADRAVAHIAVRLSDVAPDGAATRVSYGVLNLAHRDSHQHPTPLAPGEATRITVKLNDCGHAFPPGHRIRIAVASTCWPLVWPVAEAATLTIITAASRLSLPARTPRIEDADVRFAPPAHGPLTPREVVAAGEIKRSFNLDLIADEATYITSGEGGVFGEGVIRFPDIDTTVGHSLARTLKIRGNDPLSARFELTQSIDLGRDGWRIRIETETTMTSTATHYRLTGTVRTFENGEPFVTRSWDEEIAREI